MIAKKITPEGIGAFGPLTPALSRREKEFGVASHLSHKREMSRADRRL
jgi:hypothetical protein